MKKLFTLLVAFSFGSMAMGQIGTFPYTEDFEAEATCPTGCGAVCNTLIDWNNPITDDLDWLVDVAGTSSSGTGPTANGGADHTTGTSAGKYVYIETSCSGTGYPTKRGDLESPWFDFTGQSDMVLSFWYHAFGATQGTLDVEARIGMGGAWANIAGPITDDQDLWQQWSGCLGAAYAGLDSVQIRFIYVSGSSFTGDIALDDITLAGIDPVDVGVSLVSGPSGCGLSATEVISIEVCNYGDSLTSGTVIPVSFTVDGGVAVSETLTLSGGIPSYCNGGGCITYTFTGTADLSGPGSHALVAWTSHSSDAVMVNDTAWGGVNNIPVGGGLPYFENFEAGRGGWVEDNSNNGSWAFGTPAKAEIVGAGSGDSCFVSGGLTATYNANEASSVTSPCIDISTATGAEVLAMKINVSTENSWDGANIFGSVDAGVSWTQLGSFGDPMNWYDDNSISGAPNGSQEGWTGDAALGTGGWVCAQHKLDSAMMVDNDAILLRVGFGSDGSVQREGFAFDDVAIGIPFTYAALPDTITVCDTVATVDAGAGFIEYHWSNNTVGQVGEFANSGTYVLCVTDSVGMVAFDTVYADVLGFVRPGLEDVYACVGDSATFDAQVAVGPTSYMWSTGDMTQTSTLYVDGTITVTKMDSASGCMETDSAMLIYNTPVNLDDINVCMGDVGMFDATTMNGTYAWSTGDTVAMIGVNTPGTYSVTVIDSVLGCVSADTASFDFWAAPAVDLGPDVTECDMATIDAGAGFTSYAWSTSDTTQTIDVTSSGVIMVTVADTNGCSNMDTIDVTIEVGPTVNLGGDFTMCINHVVTIDAGAGASWLWSNAETTQVITLDGSVLGAGTYNYSVDVTGANTCVGTDAIVVTVDPCVGVAEVEAGVSVNLYPNPANDQVNITVEDANASEMVITLLNLQGQTVMANQFNGGTEYTITLDVSELAAGVYFVKFENNAEVMTRRLVIR